MPQTIEELRAKIFDDLATEPDWATAIGRCTRIVQEWRREPDPLPHRFIGRTVYIEVTAANEWLRRRFARPKEPRKVGRPRKQGA